MGTVLPCCPDLQPPAVFFDVTCIEGRPEQTTCHTLQRSLIGQPIIPCVQHWHWITTSSSLSKKA
ncbi:hypothetical protein NSQ43_07695 [Sporosarcina sp. FSL W8-0480]|uniref:hypothetical protein n=1 Tax=Sporosarcina sp. FSL W8-0480 TaxID=2954701 RepID=UPI0030DB1C0C